MAPPGPPACLEGAGRRGHLSGDYDLRTAALEVFRVAPASSHYVAGTECNLARAEALLAERRGKSAAE
jgi:hypothetical protein